MKRKPIFIWKVVVAVLILSACAPQAGSQAARQEVAQSDKPLLKDVQVGSRELQDLAAGNTAFAVDLYHRVSAQRENLFFSPYSISAALAMTYAGAKGATGDQIARAMHFNLPPDQLHPAFNHLYLELTNPSSEGGAGGGTPFELSVVNALWGQQDYQFLEKYLDLIAQYYGAGIRLVDFEKNADGSRQQINQWVADQTRDRIKDLIPQGAIDSLTRLVLTNAIYFKAGWRYPFEKEETTAEPFHLLDGTTVDVQTMHLKEDLGYALRDQYKALELPYEDGGVSMVFILPDEGQFETVEDRLSAELLTEITENLKTGQVNLALPKFEFDSEFNLNQALIDLGMIDAFDAGKADFSGMTGTRDLFITDAIHKAYIGVDENGTEAAAATAVVMGLTAMMPSEPVEFRFDRPFIFAIRDSDTGSLLFLGRVVNPLQ